MPPRKRFPTVTCMVPAAISIDGATVENSKIHWLFMKKIEAIIRPHKQDALLQALAQSDALTEGSALGVTVLDTVGFGRQKGHSEVYRGVEQEMGVVLKRMLIMYVNDEQVNSVVKLITDIAQTGQMGDGKIAVLPMDNLTRIRTGEEGQCAL